jgi:L-cysteine S-thiosulfotransferase
MLDCRFAAGDARASAQACPQAGPRAWRGTAPGALSSLLLGVAVLVNACGARANPDDLGNRESAAAALSGDATRGKEIGFGRDANCVLCHMLPQESGANAAGSLRGGTLAPPLIGIGARLTPAELRARVVDPKRFNPDSIMPSYARTEGLSRVAEAYAGKPILSGQQIEDVVAWLAGLR